MMIHDEIASAFYAKLTNIGVSVFKHYSNVAGERIVVQVKANTWDVLQTAQVWILIYTSTISQLPNTARLNQLSERVQARITAPFSLPSGEIVYFEPASIDGPYIDPQTPQECYLILRYKVKVKGG